MNLITGKVNPSGRLVDTYAANSLSAPACVNSGTQTPVWSNTNAVNAACSDGAENTNYVSVQAENIYVGYKYYETRYEDVVLGSGNANSTVGSTSGKAWSYADEIVYPFGYGLSYTQFEQVLDEVSVGENSINIKVTVRNVGEVAGKSVVQVYAQTPYGDYERDYGVEKSAVQLVGFAKTQLLAPKGDGVEQVEISIDKYLLASYDANGVGGYILSAGDYYLAIGDNVHSALNNILAKKQCNGMVDENGNAVVGDAEKVFVWNETFNDTTYRVAENDHEVTNRFEDCDLNYWNSGSVTYLSRSDWQNTYPVRQTVPVATDAMIKILQGESYTKPIDAPSVSSFEQGVDNGLSFLSMRSVSYDDEETWNRYLDQMTLDELLTQLPCAYGTKALTTVSKPATIVGDGMDSVGGSLPFGDKRPTCCYTSKVTLTSTWNFDLYRRRGELMGEEALYRGCMLVFNIGGNLHRTPFGGRNFEYMSEDSTMSYLASLPEAEGMLSRGVHPAIKHLVGNDQESWREGVSIMFREQAFREGSLRAFENVLRNSGTGALMLGLNRVGLWFAPQCKALITDVVRGEWGFQGFTETDGTAGVSYKHHFTSMIAAGTDIFCLDFQHLSSTALSKAIETSDDGYLFGLVRQSVKNLHYTCVNSLVVNGLSENSVVINATPWWKTALIVLDVCVGVLFCVALCFYCRALWRERQTKYMLQERNTYEK